MVYAFFFRWIFSRPAREKTRYKGGNILNCLFSQLTSTQARNTLSFSQLYSIITWPRMRITTRGEKILKSKRNVGHRVDAPTQTAFRATGEHLHRFVILPSVYSSLFCDRSLCPVWFSWFAFVVCICWLVLIVLCLWEVLN